MLATVQLVFCFVRGIERATLDVSIWGLLYRKSSQRATTRNVSHLTQTDCNLIIFFLKVKSRTGEVRDNNIKKYV